MTGPVTKVAATARSAQRDATGTGFVEVADGVHVLRYPVLDVNVTLVVGDGEALLVDTLSTAAQARELAAAARRVTDQPVGVGEHPPPLRPLLRQRHPGRPGRARACGGTRRRR